MKVLVKDSLGATVVTYDDIPGREISLSKDHYLSAYERAGTRVHENLRTVKCGLSKAEINFGFDLHSSGVGGLHIAEIRYHAYSVVELLHLRDEAHGLLDHKTIDLTAKADEPTMPDETYRKLLARATQLLVDTVNQAVGVALAKQRIELAENAEDVAETLLDNVAKLYDAASMGNRARTIEEIYDMVSSFYHKTAHRCSPTIEENCLLDATPSSTVEEIAEMLLKAVELQQAQQAAEGGRPTDGEMWQAFWDQPITCVGLAPEIELVLVRQAGINRLGQLNSVSANNIRATLSRAGYDNRAFVDQQIGLITTFMDAHPLEGDWPPSEVVADEASPTGETPADHSAKPWMLPMDQALSDRIDARRDAAQSIGD